MGVGLKTVAALAVWAIGHTAAQAGAWPQPKGEGQFISKYESATAHSAYDANGNTVAIPSRLDESLSVYGEYGLSPRLTLQGKAAFTRGVDSGVAYDGFGTSELGVRMRLAEGRAGVASLYVGGVLSGDGRYAGYAPVGTGQAGGEVRLMAGRSGKILDRQMFMETQVAAISRAGLPLDRRIDTTLGIEVARGWQVLAQSYGGSAGAARWLKGELSVVRRLNSQYSIQAGWRFPVTGRITPVEDGLVVGLWSKF